MMKIKNIVFDLGGTLLTEDDNWLHSSEVKNLLKVNDEKLSEAWNVAWPDGRDGKIGEYEFFRKFLMKAIGKAPSDKIEELRKIYKDKLGKLDTFILLPRLRKKYKLIALANILSDWLDLKIQKFNLDKYFNLIISSCGEGVAKPNKEIFLTLINKGKINPDESVFIDNMEKNIGPARELGFNTILFESLVQCESEMKKLGIKL